MRQLTTDEIVTISGGEEKRVLDMSAHDVLQWGMGLACGYGGTLIAKEAFTKVGVPAAYTISTLAGQMVGGMVFGTIGLAVGKRYDNNVVMRIED